MELKPLQRSGPAAVWFPLPLVLFGFPCRWCCLVSLGAGAAWFPLVPHAAASAIWFALLTHTSQHERCWYLHSVVALLVPPLCCCAAGTFSLLVLCATRVSNLYANQLPFALSIPPVASLVRCSFIRIPESRATGH
jgi:hypothetical protein